MSISAARRKAVQSNSRLAKVHLTLDNFNRLANGESITINLEKDKLVLELTSDTVKGELGDMMGRVSEKTDEIFIDIEKSFRRIFGK